MKKISLLLVATATLFLASCSSKESKTTEQEEATQTEMTEEVATPAYVGTYEGTLPAADAAGFKTTLTINADMTYQLTQVAEGGKEENKTEESGTYNLLENDVLELITPSTGAKTYYKVLDNSVALVSDATGTLAEGELADKYILNKVVL
ncbi:MAG: copper resistance protein NlpE [Porphyromonas somerae]|uniref:copper resistance protein NlpE n=1 Tax=Porphyromonas somerae TaxID=322095 RepID=UPI0026E9E6B9|nr:copper resistance protein NlpE [Porphyromonas somerae]MDD7557192.1 copper resistance protein NlpE [Porphyromonas somerae]MDY3119366.1 copper resistance protein NlpE [Porphyromonas somerae]MDY5814893.1 copper resistance protein NlpE [Porphyromonas somerae]